VFAGVYISDNQNGIFTGLTPWVIPGRQRLAKKTGARAPRLAKKPGNDACCWHCEGSCGGLSVIEIPCLPVYWCYSLLSFVIIFFFSVAYDIKKE
jgi:hypothetical protein